MSVSPADPAPLRGSTRRPRAGAGSYPRLPIVEFLLDEEHPLQVHFSAVEATRAAHDRPEGDFLDLRGKILTLVVEGDGTSHLVAGRKGSPAELRRRVLAALRRAAELEARGEPISDEIEAILAWLAAAPSVEFLVHGLGLARPQQHPLLFGRYCAEGCSRFQRMAWGTPPCCPKGDGASARAASARARAGPPAGRVSRAAALVAVLILVAGQLAAGAAGWSVDVVAWLVLALRRSRRRRRHRVAPAGERVRLGGACRSARSARSR